MNTILNQLLGQSENSFYGHLHILTKYCRLNEVPFLNGYLQHGWNATDGFGNYLGRKRKAHKYVWSKRCEELIKPFQSNVTAIGAPWLYLDEVYPKNNKLKRNGVVAYPSHSSTWSKMGDTHLQNAEYLYQNFKSVTVVLHRYDFANKKIKESYERFGHKTFCHGNGTPWENGFDPLFLKTQRDFLNLFEVVVANVMQTAVLYATSLGLKPIIGGPVEYTDVDDKASQVGDGKTNWNQMILNNHNLWETELGMNEKKTPSELTRILGWEKNKITYHFIKNRTKDLISGSSFKISANVLKSTFKKND